MKLVFDDKSYINCYFKDDKVTFVISAKDNSNPLKKITNAIELTVEEFKNLISDLKL